MLETASKRFTRNVRNFVKDRSSNEIILEEDRLGSDKRKDVVMGISRPVSNVCTVPSVRRRPYQWMRDGFERM